MSKGFPALTIHISSPDKDEKACLTLTLPDGSEKTGSLVLPFQLAKVPLLLRSLNARQYHDYPQQNRLFKLDEPAEEREKILQELRILKLLDEKDIVFSDIHSRVGKLLGTALLQDEVVKYSLNLLYSVAIQSGGWGEIILSFDPGALAIAALPWEVAHNGPMPLLMSNGVVLGCTRVITFAHPLPPPRPEKERLCVLTVAPYVQMDDFGITFEQLARSRLREALHNLPIDVDILSKASIEALGERLADLPEVDVLDYYGHGRLDKGSAVLLLEGINGQPDPISANRLATLQKLPPLVVLHACHSGQIDIHELLASLAPALSSAGVRAVVAMQLATRMTAATHSIIPIFYKHLAAGQSVQQAIASVRQALYTMEKDGASWYLPVLYLRQSDQLPYIPLARRIVSPNPFAGPGAIENPTRIVGREEQIRRLWERLTLGGNLSIIGKSGSGKSTMLALIMAEGQEKLAPGTKIVRLPIQRKMKELEGKLELAKRLGGQKATDLTKLLTGKHLILLLDDLGILDPGERGLDVRLWLRELSQDRPLATIQLVATSLRSLDVTFAGDNNSEDFSPLHNVMTDKIELDPFTLDEGQRFILERLKGTSLNMKHFEDLLNRSPVAGQPHPMLPRELEKACRDRYDLLNSAKNTS